MYDIAEIALVSPLRDGMNLVAKEYLATKHDKPGVLILSEMAGAAIELPEAIIINPNDTDQIESAILKALHMPDKEKKSVCNPCRSASPRKPSRNGPTTS